MTVAGKENGHMAVNFRISIHRNSWSLHLTLMGDFDGSSACEVLEVLKKNCHEISRIFIHTSPLKQIHSFGLNIFHNNLDVIKGNSVSILFTGENAEQLAPEKSKIC